MEKKTCKNCIWFEEDGKFSYCDNKDLFTRADADDKICENFLYEFD